MRIATREEDDTGRDPALAEMVDATQPMPGKRGPYRKQLAA
jgi:hypothetical protein